jgi:hypothetical protein
MEPIAPPNQRLHRRGVDVALRSGPLWISAESATPPQPRR